MFRGTFALHLLMRLIEVVHDMERLSKFQTLIPRLSCTPNSSIISSIRHHGRAGDARRHLPRAGV